jgi:hypothetical protein
VRLFAFLTFCMVFCTSANAVPFADGGYRLEWRIEAQPIPEQDFWVKEQGVVVKTRLLPKELYVADSAIFGQNKELLIPSGTQLVRFYGNDFVVCNVLAATSGLAKNRRVCIADQDHDGLPDGSFTHGLGGKFWFTLWGNYSGKPLPKISLVNIRSIPVSEMIDAPIFTLHYQRILDDGFKIPLNQEGGNKVRFHFIVESKKNRLWISRECRDTEPPSLCTSSSFPSRFEFAGLDLELLERKKEDVRMRILKSFGDQRVRFLECYYGSHCFGGAQIYFSTN